MFVVDDYLKSILHKSESDYNLGEIKRFIKSASTNDVCSIIFHQIRQESYYAMPSNLSLLISLKHCFDEYNILHTSFQAAFTGVDTETGLLPKRI